MSIDINKTDQWTESFVRQNQQACIQRLIEINDSVAQHIGEGDYMSALGGMSFMVDGAVVVNNAGVARLDDFIAKNYYYMAVVSVCGIDDASYREISETAVPLFEKAQQIPSGRMTQLPRQAVRMLKEGRDLSAIRSELFPRFHSEIAEHIRSNDSRLKGITIAVPAAKNRKILPILLIIAIILGAAGGTGGIIAGNHKSSGDPSGHSSAIADPTDAFTETEHAAETSAEAPTELPSEAVTEVPTEVPTEAPSEPPTQPPTQLPTQAPPTQPPATVPIPDLTDSLFGYLSGREFMFASGAGAWMTTMTVYPDGSFSGTYYDYDSYNVRYCEFSGVFGNVTRVGNTIYSMRILSITYANEPGTESADGQLHYYYTTPYGLTPAEDIIVYTPDTPIDELSEGYKYWQIGPYRPSGSVLGYYGIYNPAGRSGSGCGFVERY